MVELTELGRAVFGGASVPGTTGPCVNSEASVNLDSLLFPLVTIGLPVFNGADTLAAALETLVRQTYPNLQIIISDNASTDATLAICEEFACSDPRIRIIRKQVNEGPVANFRTVLEAAEGEFFMWAAADDYWYPQFISRLLPALQADPAAGVAMCAVDRRFPDGTPFDLIRFTGDNSPNGMGNLPLLGKILSGAKYNLFIYGLFRRPLLKRAMRCFPQVLGGDRQFIAQMALACRFAYVDDVLLTRTHQLKNFDAYIATMLKRGTLRKQLISFAGMILRSDVIPWYRKTYLPFAIIQYFTFCIRQKQYQRLNMIKKIARRFFLSPKSLLMVIGFLCISSAIGGLLTYFDVISSEFFVATVMVIFLLVGSGLLNRRWIIQSRKTLQHELANSRHELTNSHQKANRVEHTLDHSSQEVSQLLKELRYLSDTLLHPELAIAQTKGNPLSNHVVQRIEKHRRVIEFVRNLEDSQIREVYIQELFPGIENESVPIGVINEQTGHTNKTDMLYVSAVAKHVRAEKMFEFGTYMGRTTLYLAHNNPKGQVYTLNLPPERDPRYAPFMGVLFKGQEEEKRITQLHTDSREFDTTPYRQQFDFIFVDGDHSYELVKNDTQKAFELLKPGGTIMWHDYAPKSEGLVRFFREFTQDRPLFRIRSTCLLVYIDGIDVMNHKLCHVPHSLELELREENPYLVESLYHS